MNRTEQKERLQNIIILANDTIKSLATKKDWLLSIHLKIDELDNEINEYGDVDAWDGQNLKESIANTLFESELEQLYDEALDFKEEIESYMYELSDSKREKLEERYCELDTIVDKFSQSTSQYEDVYDVIENIQEAIHELKLMKK